MKKLLFSTLLVLSIVSLGYGQKAGFGFKFGLNMANQGGEETNLKARYDFHGGFTYAIATSSEKFMIQPELVFSREGAQAIDSDVKIKYNYINLPVVVKFFPGKIFSLQAGPQLGVLVSGNLVDGTNKSDVSDRLTEILFSMTVGAGLDFSGGIGIAVRYNFGITDNIRQPAFGGSKFTNQVLQVSVGSVF